VCDSPQFLDFRNARAAKQHLCSLCHWEIAKGEVHEVVTGVWDDVWDRFRMHLDCVEAHRALARASYDGCAPYDGIDLEEEDALRSYRGTWHAEIR
jgi:hypothetical protein